MVTLFIEDVSKSLTNRMVPAACATIASRLLLEHLIQFTKKIKKRNKSVLTT